MTSLKTVLAPATTDGVFGIEQPQPIAKTQELPAVDPSSPDGKPDGGDTEAVPSLIEDGDVTVPVHSSIESTLTFELLRRQSINDDDRELP